MQLKRIQHYLQEYRKFLTSPAAQERLYAWESQRIFQDNWDMESRDFGEMYDRSLDNSETRRLWKRENYEPKKRMLEFIAMEPDMVRRAFEDLFNEEKSAENRVDRFRFYCDDLLGDYKGKYPLSIENRHYHDDNYQMISIYLAFRFPDKYAIYDHEAFKMLLQKIGSTDIPQAADFGRFVKVMRTLYNFMQKEPDILELHQQRLHPKRHYTAESLLVMWDFSLFCVQMSEL
jgi:hypothetical protein